MLVTSVPMSLYVSAGELLMSGTERAEASEDIFYTDIFTRIQNILRITPISTLIRPRPLRLYQTFLPST